MSTELKNELGLDPENSDPLVSIILITYNSSKYVIEALDSIKEQTYKNLELVITDDASKDDTATICENWIRDNNQRFVRAEIIKNKINKGIPGNLNCGYRAAKGSWIKGIAGDDRLMPNCVRDNINYIHENPDIKILFSKKDQYVNNFDEENYLLTYPIPKQTSFFKDKLKAEDQYRMLLIRDRIALSATLFINRSMILEAGLFDERFKLCDDYPLWLKLTKSGHKLYYMPKSTVLHRAHGDSVHNKPVRNLINPSYLQREELREAVVYPNVSRKVRMAHYYNYEMSKFLKNTFNNKSHFVSKAMSKILLKYFNPLYWME